MIPSTDPLNVLATYRWQRLDDGLLRRIADVSPRVNVIYPRDEAEDQKYLPETDILYCIWLPDSLSNAKRLKWIQLLSAGYNVIEGSEVEGTDIFVTTSTGIHGTPIAEFVIASMVILSRRLLQVLAVKNNVKDLWKDFGFMGSELRGKTVGLVGMGVIGREVARLAKCFGTRVICVDVRDQPWHMPEDRYIVNELRYSPLSPDDIEVHTPKHINWLMKESDFVVLTLPLTRNTRGIVAESQLKAMKPSAFLINPARGALVDEAALIKALAEGWIAGAALDAFQIEPLPPDNPLYRFPNVLITPHMSAHTDKLWERCVDLFCENLERYINGQPLLNLVHPAT